MRQLLKISAALCFSLGLASCATPGDRTDSETALTESQQKKLDARLAGRTAGEPVSCINRFEGRKMTVISDDVIIFGNSRNSRTIFVNKPNPGCNGADRHILVTRSPSTRLCKGDIIELKDRYTGAFFGSCTWSEFVPYTKIAR